MNRHDWNDSDAYRAAADRVAGRKAVAGIIGLGYVGLPLAASQRDMVKIAHFGVARV